LKTAFEDDEDDELIRPVRILSPVQNKVPEDDGADNSQTKNPC